MSKMLLSDTRIKAAKSALEPYRLSDEKGLYMIVRPDGARWWRFDYRFQGSRKTLSFGTYPEVPLKLARIRRDEARQLIASGTDPSELRKAEKETITAARQQEETEREVARLLAAGEALPGSFRAVGEEWAERYLSDKSPDYKQKVERRLELDVYPFIGNRPVGDINAPVILEVLRRIEARGTVETAHRVKHNIGQILRYAIVTGRAENDPTPALGGALKPMPRDKHYAAPTDPKDIAPLLRMLAGYQGAPMTRTALTLAPLLFIRPGELRAMEWANIDFEACELRYTPPKTRNKTAVELIVPLSSQAVAALREIMPLTGHGKYVFPNSRSDTRPMSENTINGALHRLGIDTQNQLTGHGFRAMARTLLEEVHGFRPEILELQIAHKVKDHLGRAYNRTTHLPERKRMMQVWADYLDALREGKNVNLAASIDPLPRQVQHTT